MNVIIVLLLCLLPPQSATTVKGKVIDSKTGEYLSLVQIKSRNETPNTTLTKEDGSFYHTVTENTKYLIFSHVGYKTKTVKIPNKKHWVVKMKTEPSKLDEVIIMADKKTVARRLVEKVTLKLSETMVNQPYQALGFQRQTTQRDSQYVFFAEAHLETLNEGFPTKGHPYNISNNLQYRVSNQELTQSIFIHPIFGEEQGGRYSYRDLLQPLTFNDAFYYEIEDTIKINKINHVIIKYKLEEKKIKLAEKKHRDTNFPYTYYLSGNIVINLETHAPYKINNKGRTFLPQEKNNGIKQEFMRDCYFKEINSKSYLSKIKVTKVFKRKSLFSDSIHNYFEVTELSQYDFDTAHVSNKAVCEKYKCNIRLIKYGDRIARFCIKKPAKRKKTSTYNPDYWKEKNTPTNWTKIKTDLESFYQKPLESQFSNNTNYLISKKSIKTMMELTGTDKKEDLIRDYNYYDKNNLFND